MKKFIITSMLLFGIFTQSQANQPQDSGKKESFFFTDRVYANRHHWYWGLGAVVSQLPVIKAGFKVPFSQVLYEYNVTDPSKFYRFSLGGGLYGLNGILPVPAIQPSIYIGSENNEIMARLSSGFFSDITVGNHSAVLFSAGVIIKNRIDLSLVMVPFGIQPVRPYPEILGSLEEDFIPVEDVDYTKDPFGKNLTVYDSKHRHEDDPRFNDEDNQYYYSSYDMDYGNGKYNGNAKIHPGDFDYVKGREYISFPYFGLMLTFRHGL